MKPHSTEANCARWRSRRIVWGGIRSIGVTEQTRCPWHEGHCDLRVNEIKELNGLAREKRGVDKAVVDLTQTKWILAEAAKLDLGPSRRRSTMEISDSGIQSRSAEHLRESDSIARPMPCAFREGSAAR
jgi:hypothetical protein